MRVGGLIPLRFFILAIMAAKMTRRTTRDHKWKSPGEFQKCQCAFDTHFQLLLGDQLLFSRVFATTADPRFGYTRLKILLVHRPNTYHQTRIENISDKFKIFFAIKKVRVRTGIK